MSPFAPSPQILSSKPDALEIQLEELTLNHDAEPKDAGKTQKPPNPSSKLEVPGLLDPEAFRRLSISTISLLSDDGRGRSNSQAPHSRYASRSPAPPKTWKGSFDQFWQRNRGLWLVSTSQLFGATMNVSARLLEIDEHGMSPFQVLWVRMGVTSILCCWYMWYTKVPYFPFGMKEVRVLLVLRGLFGFFGIFGLYYSLQYLPIADVTVIGFLAPSVAGFACYILLGERFTRTEQIASVISLVGVVLIARPTSFFHRDPDPAETSSAATNSTSSNYSYPTPTSAQRLSAIALSLLGVLGAAGVFTTIRWIGKRAHPLISVNYFAVWCTFVSTVALTVSSLSPPESIWHSKTALFALPNGPKQWFLLLLLGTCGFVMQFMMTAGISHEKSNRATNMVYTNMLFALLFDRLVFGTVPGVWSLVGSSLILGSAIYVAIHKGAEEQGKEGATSNMAVADEERAMLRDVEPIEHEEDHGPEDDTGRERH